MAVDVVDVVFHEVGPGRRHVFGRAQHLGQGPFDQTQDAVSDKVAILLVGVLRKPAQGQHGIAGDGQIADRVEQRAVEIEDDKFGIHCCFLIFQPMAATSSDINGDTMLNMQ